MRVRLATRLQAQALDQQAQKEGWSQQTLIEAAACTSLQVLVSRFKSTLAQSTTFICCGRGHNGADGLALARHLHSEGFTRLRVLHVGEGPMAQETLRQQELCRKQGVRIEKWQPQIAGPAGLVVDALFGVGLSRELAGEDRACVDWINELNCPRISLDVPSGLDCTRGVPLGAAVYASLTISFGPLKLGYYLENGPEFVGEISAHSIGLPAYLWDTLPHTLITAENLRPLFRPRSPLANKTHFGHAALIAGSNGMWGAALLAAQSCFRSGVGYATLISDEDLKPLLAQFPEVMTKTMEQVDFSAYSAVGVGPGLPVSAATGKLISSLKEAGVERVVVDAGAWTECVRSKLYPLPSSWIVTPHAGELARLLDQPAEWIEQNRVQACELACERLGCHVVLKGRNTLLALPSGELQVIAAGNQALAKAGAGDVLTGLITGFLAQQFCTVNEAAALAIYIHGTLADHWVKEGLSDRGLQASDLIARLPQLLGRLEKESL